MGWRTVPAEPDPHGAEDDCDWDEPFALQYNEPLSTICMSEAIWWLKEYRKRRGKNYQRYHRKPASNLNFGKAGVFLHDCQVKQDISVRQGYRTRTDPGFLLDQWIKANAYMHKHWPREAEKVAPRHLVLAVCEALGYADIR